MTRANEGPHIDVAEQYQALFGEDDYAQIYESYFAQIVRSRAWSALPAGWYNPYSAAAEQVVPVTIKGVQVQQYALDEAHSLEEVKTDILHLVEAWERRPITYSELTLLPSVSSANLTTMAVLAGLGFHTAVFETPTYYASIDQAKLLGPTCVPLPSYRHNDFVIDYSDFERAIQQFTPCSVWITQPRFGIGSNQTKLHVEKLAAIIGPKNVLVIDEAAEQNFPSTLSTLRNLPCPVVRTRGLVKGIGLNGMRIAFAIHPAQWRGAYEEALETTGASLDRFSLANARMLAREPHFFASLLAAARDQVRMSQKAASVALTGTSVEASTVENGYMGTLMIDLTAFEGSYGQKRTALLNACRALRLPVVLKVSAGFASDDTWEGVRMNYFTSRDNAVKSAEILVRAVGYVRDQNR